MDTLEKRAADSRTKLGIEEKMHGQKRKGKVGLWLERIRSLSCEIEDQLQKSAGSLSGRKMGSPPDKLKSEATRLDVEPVYRPRITSWQRGKLLGSGSFGVVYEAFTEDRFCFAVKEISLLDQQNQGSLILEEDDTKLYIYLELMKGSLAKHYNDYVFSNSQVSAYTSQILNGLKYLHDQNVVHRDIKCANILVDANGSAKLADFGLAKATSFSFAKTSIGTTFWVAPEVLSRRKIRYGPAADIWSLGCTVLEMFTRQPPYSHLEPMQALLQISKGKRPEVPNSLSSGARDFILKCLQADPKKRPTVAQLLDHPFVRER